MPDLTPEQQRQAIADRITDAAVEAKRQVEVERDSARALVRRLADCLSTFVAEHSDPGTEVLAALWCARHEPVPDQTPRLAGGKTEREALVSLLYAAVADVVEGLRSDRSDAFEPESPPSREMREGFDYALDLVRDDLPDRFVDVLLGTEPEA